MVEPHDGTAPAQEPRSLGWLVFRSPLALFILGVPVYLASLFFLLGTGLPALDFWYSRHARMFHLLMALQPVLWSASILSVLKHLRSPHSFWPSSWAERLVVMLCAVLCALLTALPFFFQSKSSQPVLSLELMDGLTGVPGWNGKMLAITLFGSLNAALLSASLFGLHVQLIRGFPGMPPHAGASLEEEVRRYQRLRSQLVHFLSLSAATIGLAILNMGVFRNLLQAAPTPLPEMLPATAFMAYGLYFSGLLASIYVPAHRTLILVGEGLAKQLVQQSLPTRARWKEWTEEHQAIRNHLGLQGSALQDLQQGLTVLSPLLASISTLVLDMGG